MGKWILSLAGGLIALLLVAIPASSSNISDYSPEQIHSNNRHSNTHQNEINALRLRCKVPGNKTRTSYATILKLETSNNAKQKYDIAITTGHGLLGKDGKLLKECFVRFPGSKPYPVTAAKLAPNYRPGSPSDWAALIIPKIRNDDLVRYAVGNKLTQKAFTDMAEKRPSVLFAAARGLPINTQHCTLEPRRDAGMGHKIHVGLFSHTCRAIAGQSGSPISILQNNEPIALGIHIGNSMIYGYPTLDTPLHYRGYMRGIDEEFMVEFSAVLAELNTQLQK